MPFTYVALIRSSLFLAYIYDLSGYSSYRYKDDVGYLVNMKLCEQILPELPLRGTGLVFITNRFDHDYVPNFRGPQALESAILANFKLNTISRFKLLLCDPSLKEAS